MYELHFRDTTAAATTAVNGSAAAAAAAATPPIFTVARMAEAVDLEARLADRERLPPAELDAALAARSDAHSLGRQGTGGVKQLRTVASKVLFIVPGTAHAVPFSAGREERPVL